MTTPKSSCAVDTRNLLLALISIFLCLSPRSICAQQDTAWAFQLIDSSYVVKLNDPSRARIMIEEAITIFESVLEPNDTLLIAPYVAMGNVLDDFSEFQKSLDFHAKALSVYQKSGLNHPMKLGNIYNNIGNVNNVFGKYDVGIEYLEKAIEEFERGSTKSHKLKKALSIGNLATAYLHYHKIEEALFYNKLAIKLQEEISDTVTIQSARNHFNYSATLAEAGIFKESIENVEIALEIIIKLLGEDHFYVGMCYNNMGVIAMRKGDVEDGKKYYSKGLDFALAHKENDHKNLAMSYNNMGAVYKAVGDFDKALDFYEKSKSINSQIFDGDHTVFGDYYNNTSSVFFEQGRYQEAMLNQEKSVVIYEKAVGDTYGTAKILTDLASLETKIGDPNNAIPIINRSIGIIEKQFDENHKYLTATYTALGNAYLKLDLLDKAEVAYNRTEELYLSNDLGRHPDRVLPLLKLSQVHLKNNKVQEARATIEKAFDIVDFNINDEKYSIRSQVYLVELTDALSYLRMLYHQKFKSENIVYRDSLVIVNDHIFSLIESRIENVIDPETKRTIFGQAKEQYGLAIEDYIDLGMAEEAFALSDKMKARTLNTSIQKSVYADNFNIPDSLIQLEVRFQAQINKYQQNLYNTDFASDEIDSLQAIEFDKLFEVKRNRDKYYENLRNNYPDYWQQVYKPISLKIEEIQEKLSSKQSYLQYFIQNDSSIIAFLVNEDDFDVKVLRHDGTVEANIVELRNLINNNQSKEDIDRITAALYSNLLKPFGSKLKFEILVSPDGILSLLPFEVLRKGDGYLIEEHCVSYHYSTQLWDLMEHKKIGSKKELLSLAPTFDDFNEEETMNRLKRLRSDFSALLYNQDEARSVAELWGGKFLSPEESNLETFLELAPQYEILHLATHGKADDKKGEYSYLVLKSDADTIAQKLYLKDLYGLDLSSQLVVLSACETGSGEIQQGEGIMSMAHGFAMAGTQSIVPTLWSINDKSSSQIIVDFFKNLKSGQKKNLALRDAKLSYLKTNPNASPFYWAPFIPIGDISPIQQGIIFQSTGSLFAVSFFGLFFLWLWRRNSV